MDKKARILSARKKLENFRRKREVKAPPVKENEVQMVTNHQQSTELTSNGHGIIATSAANDNLQAPRSGSTGSSAESIMQVSSTLNGLIAEVESLTENGTGVYFSGATKTLSEQSNSSENIPGVLDDTMKDLQRRDDTIKDLQSRNVELMDRLGAVEVEREQLRAQHQQLSEYVSTISQKNAESDTAHSQLEAQKQTIEILVSEKQDLQRRLNDVQMKAQSENAEQMVLQETLQSYKKQIDACVAEIGQQKHLITTLQSTIEPLKAEHESYREESMRLAQSLEREKLQTSELSMKLNMRESELNQVVASHSDLQEKLNMAEVLLQQYSTRKDEMSDTARLEAENRHLSHDLQNLHLALEKLADERDHIIKQHTDSKRDWENHIQDLQSQILTLQEALEKCIQVPEPGEESNNPEIVQPEDVPQPEATITTNESACQTDDIFDEAVSALTNNNRQLSQMLQEREMQIQRLENELHESKSVIQDHESLLDTSRNDKVTISRALSQNKQLKEQLEEIQNMFITISNDKMDLATQLSTLEAVNKNLSHRLKELTDTLRVTKLELANDKNKLAVLEDSERHIIHMTQSQTNGANAHHQTQNVTILDVAPTNVMENESDVIKDTNRQDDEDEVPSPDWSVVDLVDVESNVPEIVKSVGSETEMIGIPGPETVIQNEIDDPIMADNVDESNTDNGMNSYPEPLSDSKASEPVSADPKMMEMLQQKFTSVMQERADLMNRVEMLEHANTQLQNECDTIGEYITLYHNQRQLLKQRHHEKDAYISSIIQEREEMRGKVEQLQTLVGTVLKSGLSTPSKLQNGDDELGSSKESLISDPDVSLPQPDLVPKTESGDSSQSTVTRVHHPKHIQNEADNLAAQQILNLLQQMQKPAEPPSPTSSRPSGFCMHYIGPYTAI